MAAEKNYRQVNTGQGTVRAVPAPNARQTYVALPTKPAGVSAQYGGKVAVILAPNARQTHP